MQTYDFNTDLSENAKGKNMRLIFSGYLTLQNANKIKSNLLSQKGDFSQIELVAKDVRGIDVSFLQLVESFRQTNEQEGKKVKIAMDLPYDLKTLMANAGIAYPVK